LLSLFQKSPILEPYRSALDFNFIRHAVSRTEYQETGSEACRRKFLSINQSFAGVSIDDGAVDGDGSPAQNSLGGVASSSSSPSSSNRGKKTADKDKRGTNMSGKGVVHQRAGFAAAEARHPSARGKK